MTSNTVNYSKEVHENWNCGLLRLVLCVCESSKVCEKKNKKPGLKKRPAASLNDIDRSNNWTHSMSWIIYYI